MRLKTIVPVAGMLCVGLLPPAAVMAAGRTAPEPRVLAFLRAPELRVFGQEQQAGPVAAKPLFKADIVLPEGDGKDAIVRHCGMCHSTDLFAKQRHTREKWSSIMDNMVAKGMVATDDELDGMTEYLTKNFGPEPAKDATPPAAAGK